MALSRRHDGRGRPAGQNMTDAVEPARDRTWCCGAWQNVAMGGNGGSTPSGHTPRPVRSMLIVALVLFLVLLVILRIGVAYSIVLTVTALLFVGAVAIIRRALSR
jgi:hypothetical protein